MIDYRISNEKKTIRNTFHDIFPTRVAFTIVGTATAEAQTDGENKNWTVTTDELRYYPYVEKTIGGGNITATLRISPIQVAGRDWRNQATPHHIYGNSELTEQA